MLSWVHCITGMHQVPLLPEYGSKVFYPKRQILESSKLKQFADDNFSFDENERKFSNRGRKQCGKTKNCSLQAISPLPTLFSKDMYFKHVKTRKGLINWCIVSNNTLYGSDAVLRVYMH